MNESSPVLLRRRWLGVLLSLLVPGFGIIRAGQPRRGLIWLGVMLCISFIAGLALSLSIVPLALTVQIFVASIIIQIVMLFDSCRPGKMNGRLWLLFFALAAALIWLPLPGSWVGRAFKIPSRAMEPTLHGSMSGSTADHVIADRVSYRFSAPQRGDLIVFAVSQIPAIQHYDKSAGEVFYIKRLVGLPGERIRISEGKIYANGKLLSANDGIPAFTYIEQSGIPSSAKREGQDYVVGPNEYFALGDNTENSYDSRYWGCVPAASIYGKITLIYYPFSRAGRLSKP